MIATFDDGPNAARPAVTRQRHGDGAAWYVATMPDAAGVDAIVGRLVADRGVRPVIDDLPAGVEVARRGALVTVINHSDETVTVSLNGSDAETGAALGRTALSPQQVVFAFAPIPAHPSPAPSDANGALASLSS